MKMEKAKRIILTMLIGLGMLGLVALINIGCWYLDEVIPIAYIIAGLVFIAFFYCIYMALGFHEKSTDRIGGKSRTNKKTKRLIINGKNKLYPLTIEKYEDGVMFEVGNLMTGCTAMIVEDKDIPLIIDFLNHIKENERRYLH